MHKHDHRDRPPRVAFIVAHYHTFSGSQRSLLILLSALQGYINPVVVFPAHGQVPPEFSEAGIDTLVLRGRAGLRSFGLNTAGIFRKMARIAHFGLSIIDYNLRLRRFFQQEHVVIVHANDPRALLASGLSARLLGIPLVWHLRGSLAGGWSTLTYLYARLTRPYVIAVSRSLLPEIPATLRASVVYNAVGPYPVDNTHESERSRATNVQGGTTSTGRLSILTASSIVPYKGLHHLATALWAMRQTGPIDFFWTILGGAGPNDSGYCQSLVWYVESLGLSDNVEWIGWDSNAFGWFQQSDVVVLPTVAGETVELGDGRSYEAICTEGLPRVVLEAMAAGCAVIATDVAGVGELIQDGITGLVVPPGEPDPLKEALFQLQREVDFRHALGAAAQKESRRFSVGRNVRGILRIYDDLLTR